jgi:hypothetical protein
VSASPSASAAPSAASRDPCQAACDHHWLLEHRKERFCGYGPHRRGKLWDTKQCREATRELEGDAATLERCDCEPRLPAEFAQVEPEVDTPACKSSCDEAARLRYDMWEVCFRLPFQKLYDDPKCRQLEAKFFALDRKQIDACRCHYVGNERAVAPDQCAQACRRRSTALNRYYRLCGGSSHHFMKRLNTKNCQRWAGWYPYEKRATEGCECPRMPPLPKHPESSSAECRALCKRSTDAYIEMNTKCRAGPSAKDYALPECYDLEERFFGFDPAKLESCGCHFDPHARLPNPSASSNAP